MLYSIGETGKYGIILAAVVIAAAAVILFLAAYKTFSRMFGIYSKTYLIRANKSRGKDKLSDDKRSAVALEAAEDAKKLFFTRRIAGSAFYAEDKLWAKKPREYKLARGEKNIFAYFFNAGDFEIRRKFIDLSGVGKGIEDLSSKKFAIVLHGYDQCGLDNYKAAFEFMRRGINVLSPDLTGHGKDCAKFVSYGYRDRLYIKAWIEFILSHCPDAEIYLYGVSMGGAAALYALGENLPENVKACISDCAFARIYDECVKQFRKKSRLPLFPIMNIVNLYGKLLLKYNIKKASVVSAAAGNETVPVLLFHGEDDKFVTPDRAQTLFENIKTRKELVIYPQTRHAESMVLNYADYWNKIEAFISSGGNEVKENV